MDSSNLQCQICFLDYNSADRAPRIIPACGHTLCTACIAGIISHKRAYIFQCPFDKVQFEIPQRSSQIFPKNFALLQILESKPEEGSLTTCPLHHKMLRFICINCKQKICADCAKIPAHDDHEIHVINDIKKAIEVRATEIEDHVNGIENDYKFPTRKLDSTLYDREKQLLKKVELRFDVYFKILQQTKKNIETEIQKLSNDARYAMLERYNDCVPSDQENQMTKELMQWRGRAKQSLYNWKAEQSLGANKTQELGATDYAILEIDINNVKDRRKEWKTLRKENEKFQKIMGDINKLEVAFDSDNSLLTTFPKYHFANFDKFSENFPTVEETAPEEEKKEQNPEDAGKEYAKKMVDSDPQLRVDQSQFENTKPNFLEKLEGEKKMMEAEYRDNDFESSWNGPQFNITYNEKPKYKSFFNSVVKFATNTKNLPSAYQHMYTLKMNIEEVTDKSFEKFIKPFSRLLNLKSFTIRFTAPSTITYPSIEGLAKALSKLFQLEYLHIDQVQCPLMSADGVSAMMYSISQLPCLEVFKYQLPILDAETKNMYALADGIANALPKMKALSNLCLEFPPNRYINDQSVIKVTSGCFELSKLSSLELVMGEFQALTAKGTSNMLQYVSNMVQLKKLIMHFDIKKGENMHDIAQCLPNFYNLDYLGLVLTDCRNVSQDGLVAIGEAFSELIYLKGLQLEFKKYHGGVIWNLGDYINRLKNLKTLKFKFSNCVSQYDNLGKMFQPLMILSNIESFSVAYPKFSINEIKIINQFLANQKKIKSIHVELDDLLENVNDENFMRLMDIPLKSPDNVQNFVLHLYNAETLGDGSLIRILDAVPKMKNLTNFELTYNRSNASDIIVSQLVKALMNASHIKKVSLVLEECELHRR